MAERDRWASGEAYEPYVGRWSRLVAKRFIEWLAPPPSGRWLDVGCGTGALTRTILDLAAPSSVTGIDPSAGYVAYARGHIDDPRATFREGDAQRIPADPHEYDHVVSALVLNFVAEPTLALSEMRRVARPDGTVAAYVWDYAEGMEMIRAFWDAAIELDPAATALDEGARFPLCAPDPLRSLWTDAGLRDVDVEAIEVTTTFRDFDDYWGPFLGGQGPAPTYVAGLPEQARARLEDLLRRRLGTAADGSIHLRARAWAVGGRA